MDYESLTIRIPLDLKNDLEQVAESEQRSVSGQVRFFLEQAVRRLNKEYEEFSDENH